jgi:F-type H+-transporting ATPase subunit a
MITNLFSTFDPSSSILRIGRNVSIIIVVIRLTRIKKTQAGASIVIKYVLSTIKKETGYLLEQKKGNSKIVSIVIWSIVSLNLISLFPHTFAVTAHPFFTLNLALGIWVPLMILSISSFPKGTITHLVPQGTPVPLINFMVLIELVRNLIRPITLFVRLTANIIAGHLLISLIGNFFLSLDPKRQIITSSLPRALTLLETAVSCIQAYVFATLVTLYAAEIHYDPKISPVSHGREKPLAPTSLNLGLVDGNILNLVYKYTTELDNNYKFNNDPPGGLLMVKRRQERSLRPRGPQGFSK